MDQELKGSAARQGDVANILEDDLQIKDDSGMEEHASILANLLQSLDAGGGGPGPVQSMMRAMGQEPPLLPSDVPDDDDGDDSDEEG